MGKEFLEKSAEIESIMLATVDESHKINILLKMKNIRILSFCTYDTIVWTTKRRRYGGICRRITKIVGHRPLILVGAVVLVINENGYVLLQQRTERTENGATWRANGA